MPTSQPSDHQEPERPEWRVRLEVANADESVRTVGARHEVREIRKGIFTQSIDSDWVTELPSIGEALREHFAFDPLTTILPPSVDPDRLRDELMRAAPAMCKVGRGLMDSLTGNAVAILVPKLHLQSCAIEQQRILLYSLSAIMGYPSAADRRENTVVWPVFSRVRSGGEYFATFSEHNNEAEYHSDTQYDSDPERYFFLYVNRAARCGGGVSRIRANAEVIRYLEASPEGRAALTALRNRLYPFRVPSVFTSSGSAQEVAYHFAPILTQQDTFRWRRDTLEKGLNELREFDTAEVRESVGILLRALDDAPEELVICLEDDSMVLVDNHRALHARTSFTDQDRFLFRVRFHDKGRACANLEPAAIGAS